MLQKCCCNVPQNYRWSHRCTEYCWMKICCCFRTYLRWWSRMKVLLDGLTPNISDIFLMLCCWIAEWFSLDSHSWIHPTSPRISSIYRNRTWDVGRDLFCLLSCCCCFKLWSPETLTLGDCFTQDDGLGGCRCVRHHGAASWLNATDQGPIDWNHSAVRIYCFAWFTLFVSMYVCIYIYT